MEMRSERVHPVKREHYACSQFVLIFQLNTIEQETNKAKPISRILARAQVLHKHDAQIYGRGFTRLFHQKMKIRDEHH